MEFLKYLYQGQKNLLYIKKLQNEKSNYFKHDYNNYYNGLQHKYFCSKSN